MFLSRDDPSAITTGSPISVGAEKIPHRLKKGDDDHGEIMRQTTNMDLVFFNEMLLLLTTILNHFPGWKKKSLASVSLSICWRHDYVDGERVPSLIIFPWLSVPKCVDR